MEDNKIEAQKVERVAVGPGSAKIKEEMERNMKRFAKWKRENHRVKELKDAEKRFQDLALETAIEHDFKFHPVVETRYKKKLVRHFVNQSRPVRPRKVKKQIEYIEGKVRAVEELTLDPFAAVSWADSEAFSLWFCNQKKKRILDLQYSISGHFLEKLAESGSVDGDLDLVYKEMDFTFSRCLLKEFEERSYRDLNGQSDGSVICELSEEEAPRVELSQQQKQKMEKKRLRKKRSVRKHNGSNLFWEQYCSTPRVLYKRKVARHVFEKKPFAHRLSASVVGGLQKFNFQGKVGGTKAAFAVSGTVDHPCMLAKEVVEGTCMIINSDGLLIATGSPNFVIEQLNKQPGVEQDMFPLNGKLFLGQQGDFSFNLLYNAAVSLPSDACFEEEFSGMYHFKLMHNSSKNTLFFSFVTAVDTEGFVSSDSEDSDSVDDSEFVAAAPLNLKRLVADSNPEFSNLPKGGLEYLRTLQKKLEHFECSLCNKKKAYRDCCMIDFHRLNGDFFLSPMWMLAQQSAVIPIMHTLIRLKNSDDERIRTDALNHWLPKFLLSKTVPPMIDRVFDLVNCFESDTYVSDESDYESADPGDSAFSSFIKGLFGAVKWTVSSVASGVKELVKKIFGFFSDLLCILGGHIKQAFDKVVRWMLEKFIEAVDPHTLLDKILAGCYEKFFKVVAFICVLILIALGIVSYTVGWVIASRLVGTVAEKLENYEAAGPENCVGSAIGICSFLLGSFISTDASSLARRARDLTALVAGGTVLVSGVRALLFLLPDTLCHAILVKFGTRKQVATYRIKNWIPMATALIKVSSVPAVLMSDEFFKRVNDVINEANGLNKDCPTELKSQFLGLYMTLLKKLVILQQFKVLDAKRLIPFSMHVAGEPGVGKSFMVYKLLRECFNVTPTDVYVRPVNTDYWSGYYKQKTILYDEFLVGSSGSEVAQKIALEYLTLVSPTPFQPDLASVDNPAVGVKGTFASPEVVITMNNQLYDAPNGIDVHAFQRRRNIVVEVVFRKDAKMKDANTVDQMAYTAEERENMEWAAFRVLPGQFSHIKDIDGPWMDYRQLCEIVQFVKEEHLEVSKIISQVIHDEEISEVTATQIIETALRESNSIPEGQISIMDALMSWLFEGEAAAPGKNRKKKPNSPINGIMTDEAFRAYRRAHKFCKPGEFLTREELSSFMRDPMFDHKMKEDADFRVMIEKSCLELGVVLSSGDSFSLVEGAVGGEEPPVSSFEEVSEGLSDFNLELDSPQSSDSHNSSFTVLGSRVPDLEDLKLLYQRFKPENNMPDGGSTSVKQFKEPVDRLEILVDENLKEISDNLANEQVLHRRVSTSSDTPSDSTTKTDDFSECETYDLTLQKTVVSTEGHFINVDGKQIKVVTDKPHLHCCCCCGKTIAHSHSESVAFHMRPICDICLNGERKIADIVYVRRPEESNSEYWKRYSTALHDCIKLSVHCIEQEASIMLCVPGAPVLHPSYVAVGQFNNVVSGFLTALSFSVTFLVVTYAIKKLLCPSVKEEVSFTECSAKPHKESRARANKGKGFVKGLKGFESAGRDVDLIKLFVEEYDQPFYAVPICERFILGYSHCLTDQKLLSGSSVIVEYRGVKYEEILDKNAFSVDYDRDIFIYQLQNYKIPQFPNIMSKFPSKNDLMNCSNSAVRLVHPDKKVYSRCTKRVNPINYGSDLGLLTLQNSMVAEMDSKKGDCGLPIIANSGPLTGKILGILVAVSINGSYKTTVFTPVDRESLAAVINVGEKIVEVDETAEFVASAPTLGPNVYGFGNVDPAEKVFMPSKTKLKPSLISSLVDWESKKKPAILSSYDSRSKGIDPAIVCIENLSQTQQLDFSLEDMDIIDNVFENIKEQYEEYFNGRFDLKGELTIEEAIGGVPGMLSSLKVSTSPGLPRLRGRSLAGKLDCFSFDGEGQLHIDEQFRKDVMNMVDTFKNNIVPEHIWLGFLKDELVSPEKIENVRTRVIYCGDVTIVVALRILYGKVLLAFNNCFEGTPMAIGMNQFSLDMSNMYNYLTEKSFNKFIAGDYKAFDMRMQRVFQDKAYDVILGFSDANCTEAVKACQMDCSYQIGDYSFKVKGMNASGCLFTSVLNSIVNEAYFRFCFAKVNPQLLYDDHVRAKFLGDDHVLAVSDTCKFNGPLIQETMKLLNQVYTSDQKEDLVIPDYRRFDEITFLGAHPVMIKECGGLWSGALKKDTLKQTLLWTRNDNLTLLDECIQMVELASQWGKDFFEEYKNVVRQACACLGLSFPVLLYNNVVRTVAARTAVSGSDFPVFESAGPPTARGLTNLVTDEANISREVSKNLGWQNLLNEPPMDLSLSTDTLIVREVFEWNETAPVGSILRAYQVPWGVLGIGNVQNIQNMPFSRYVYWRGDVELTFQLNGTPFQNGVLCVFWYPLYEGTTSDFPLIQNWTTCQHILLCPRNNTTGSIRVPYNFVRSALNTSLEGVDNDSLGTLYVGVLSPLKDPNGQGVSVSMYSSFPDSVFTIPKPLNFPDIGFSAAGVGPSKITNNTNYNIERMVGDMPIENRIGPVNTTSTTADLGLPGLDNPIVAGNAVPMVSKFPALSKSEGPEVTNNLSLVQNEITVEHMCRGDSEESLVSTICGKRGYIGAVEWTDAMAPDTTLQTFSLDSKINNSFNAYGSNSAIPANIAMLNMFQFWHADLLFEFHVVRTSFHSGRLRFCVGYGVTDFGTFDTPYFNTVMDFNGDNDVHKVVVPYNHSLEWLETYSGDFKPLMYTQGSMGTAKLVVQTKLRHPETVSASVSVMVFVSFVNVRVAVPRPIPFVHFDQTSSYSDSTLSIKYAAAAPELPGMVSSSEDLPDKPEPVIDTTAVGETISHKSTNRTNKFFGRKFEHEVKDIHELGRRYSTLIRIEKGGYYKRGSNLVQSIDGTVFVNLNSFDLPGDDGTSRKYAIGTIPVVPIDVFRHFFAMWAGSLKFRFHSDNVDHLIKVGYIPGSVREEEFSNINAGVNLDLNRTQGQYYTRPGKLGGNLTISAVGPGSLRTAEELSYSPGAVGSWLDVNVPFYVNLERLVTNLEFGSNGLLNFQFDVTYTDPSQLITSDWDFEIFCSLGDDFRYSVWRPPIACYLGPRITGAAVIPPPEPPTVPRFIGGWRMAL